MTDTEWKLKEPSGKVSEKHFPYETNFWNITDVASPYYVGLAADIGMEPRKITEIFTRVSSLLSDFPKLQLNETNTDQNMQDLINNLGSDWYSDKVWLSTSNDTGSIFVEPESDGTEIGVFFYGPNAEENYNLFLKRL